MSRSGIFKKISGLSGVVILAWGFLTQPALAFQISEPEALRIAAKIWYNESAGSLLGLTDWNAGETFASLGIGHFIWYPAGKNLNSSDSFTQLLRYMQSHGVQLPYWLADKGFISHCPWITRSDFLRARQSPLMNSLRQFLMATLYWQVQYMIERTENALPRMLANVDSHERPYIAYQFERVGQTPMGVYALVDYVNFKGEGIGYSSQQGWGLLQVLEMMRYAPNGLTAVEQFAWAADRVLTRRVAQSDPRWGYAKWLGGWRHRIRSYLDPLQE